MEKINRLISYVDEIKQLNGSSAAALRVIHKGSVVLDHYSGSSPGKERPISQASQFHVASARKSYLALALSYAIYEGKIGSLDDAAALHFPDMNQKLLEKTAIRHLATHTHGLDERDGEIYREFAAGTNWSYTNTGVKMIAELIHKVYGRPFTLLLKEKVFNALGFRETGWRTDPNEDMVEVILKPGETVLPIGGTDSGMEGNLFVSAREFAAWGYLHLRQGFMKGKQIIPKEVVDVAVSFQSPPGLNRDLPENGIFWYVQKKGTLFSELGEKVPGGSYQILGNTGPTLLVIPAYDLVVAKMYNKKYNFGGDRYLHYLREFSNLAAETFAPG
ncbi:serine hydrolase domain-containing protein [Peribacillus sp. SCS-26]|uniref:serine hydrolase domain-containing protein n=1 Tax=Paraperibacillus marinus TaxID=3115295 RepID=UPI0039062381